MSMNDDIKEYPIYTIRPDGGLMTAPWVTSVDDYNHSTHQIHHYILKGLYDRNREWYDEHNVKQKLFLLPIWVHEQVHLTAVKNMTDEEFKDRFGVSRWELLFNRNYSEY